MRAVTVATGVPQSARLEAVPEPRRARGDVLVEARAVGICGTDREIFLGLYGTVPAEREPLILGQGSLGRVIEAPPGAGCEPGDWLVTFVRHPDPVPCESCARGYGDMCQNGAHWTSKCVLVAGAGPIGLLGALPRCTAGLPRSRPRRNTDGPKPRLVSDLSASYHRRHEALGGRRLARMHGVPRRSWWERCVPRVRTGSSASPGFSPAAAPIDNDMQSAS